MPCPVGIPLCSCKCKLRLIRTCCSVKRSSACVLTARSAAHGANVLQQSGEIQCLTCPTSGASLVRCVELINAALGPLFRGESSPCPL